MFCAAVPRHSICCLASRLMRRQHQSPCPFLAHRWCSREGMRCQARLRLLQGSLRGHRRATAPPPSRLRPRMPRCPAPFQQHCESCVDVHSSSSSWVVPRLCSRCSAVVPGDGLTVMQLGLAVARRMPRSEKATLAAAEDGPTLITPQRPSCPLPALVTIRPSRKHRRRRFSPTFFVLPLTFPHA